MFKAQLHDTVLEPGKFGAYFGNSCLFPSPLIIYVSLMFRYISPNNNFFTCYIDLQPFQPPNPNFSVEFIHCVMKMALKRFMCITKEASFIKL